MNPTEQNVRENEMERHDTMKRMKLCAFADEADPQLAGQIKALTENQIPYIELRGLETGSVIALSDRGARGGEVLSVEPHLAIFAGLSQLEREQRNIREDVYPSKRAAFDVAVRALREILDT